LPPVKLEVTEHRVMAKECPRCGEHNLGSFPEDVPGGASYGAGVKGFLAYVTTWHLLPSGRSCELFADLFHHPSSEGTLQAANATCAAELAETTALIKEAICQAEVGHFDETGLDVAGERHWLHVASTEQLTAYAPHPKRGSTATAAIGILPNFSGVAVHEGLSSYLTYACRHALCNAHHLRELTFIHEQMQQVWAQQMKDLLVASKHEVEAAQAAGETRLGAERITELERHYDEILKAGFAVEQRAEPPPSEGKRGRKKQSKAKNLLARLTKYKEETLRFLKDFRVPFDNNLAERDLRMMKVQQKVSGCFRTSAGATNFCRIRSYLSTMRKQAHNPLSVLKSVFLGPPLAPNLPG
jgi:transposase